MNSRIAVTLGAVAVCAVLGISVANYDRSHPIQPAVDSREEPQNSLSAPSQPPLEAFSPITPSSHSETPQTSSSATEGYWLRSDEGRLGVFLEGSDTPEMVFDVYIKHLPQADRLALEQGLYVEGYEQLVGLIEDYIS